MATSPVIPGCGVLKIVWSGPQRTWLNVLGFKATGAFPSVDQAFANFVHSTVGAAVTSSGLASHLALTTVFERVMVRSLNAPNQAEISSTGTPIAGAGPGDSLPLSVACVVTLRTALAGKSFRGRVYITGYDEAENDVNGRITTAASNAAAAFITTINTNLLASGVPLAVLSRPFGGKTIPQKIIPARTGQGNFITAAIVRNTKWESQRRRTGRS